MYNHSVFADLIPKVHGFRNRTDAGNQLANRLEHLTGKDVLVLGIPRGGVPVAAEIARRLNAELDVIVARKLGAPQQPELAIGAVTATGSRYLNVALVRDTDVTPEVLEAVTAREMNEARRREEQLRSGRPAPRIDGRVVIVVDDGLATGATMRAAVRSLREGHPAQLLVAVPVAPSQTCAALRAEAHDVIALLQPDPFFAVGLHYADFTPTGEHEVRQLLEDNQEKVRRTRDAEHQP